jgi:hypothetical protein
LLQAKVKRSVQHDPDNDPTLSKHCAPAHTPCRPVPLEMRFIGVSERNMMMRNMMMNNICYDKVGGMGR